MTDPMGGPYGEPEDHAREVKVEHAPREALFRVAEECGLIAETEKALEKMGVDPPDPWAKLEQWADNGRLVAELVKRGITEITLAKDEEAQEGADMEEYMGDLSCHRRRGR